MRDDFDLSTKDVLARRVGYRCSNPSCTRLTSGPQTNPAKAVNIGVAAHITAASPGGYRYEPNLETGERKSIGNGIWLCQVCAKLIDSDEQKYTVELLFEWKKLAEEHASSEIESLSPERLSPESKQILVRIEGLAESGFAEINQRLSQIENMQNVFGARESASSDSTESSKGEKPSAYENQGNMEYLILGLEDDELLDWFYLFGDPPSIFRADPEFQEVYFDDFNEMQEIFASVKKVATSAKEIEKLGGSSQDAFLRALYNEGISRAGNFFIQRMRNKQSGSMPTKGTIPGYKYMVWGVPYHIARTIQILRTQQFIDGPTVAKRDAHEVCFRNIYVALEIPTVMEKVIRESNDNKEEFIRLLFEEVMRLRTFGPTIPK